MARVREILDLFPFDEAPIVLERDEELLLQPAGFGPPGSPPREAEPLEVVYFDPEYQPKPFSPPKDVYATGDARIEWQDMKGRQPFYHRNLTVDELSLQVFGPRMLITELGTVELEPGDLVKIPVGVSHDNWGREEIHILMYVPTVAEDQLPSVKRSEPHVFDDWEPAAVKELISAPLGSTLAMADEQLLIDKVHTETRRLEVMRDDDNAGGTNWVWKAPTMWIGSTVLAPSAGLEYVRHRNVDEMQYQISGRRTLVSQRGTVELVPGDFVSIPGACAFTSINGEPSRHMTILSTSPIKRVAEATKQAERRSIEELERLRMVAV